MEKKSKMSQDAYWIKLTWVNNILKRYVKNELNPEEEQIVSNWNPGEIISPLQHVKLSKRQIENHGEKVRQNVLSACDIGTNSLQKRVVFPFSLRKYAAVAAVFVLAFGLSYFMFFNSNSPIKNSYALNAINRTTILQTAAGEIKELTLADGTKLHVNGNTHIEYNKNQFNKSKREVWLSGEAFFEVAKNPDKPFIIHSGNLQTTVKGTSFNVKAYKEIGEINVSVRSGKVEVGTDGETFGLLTANKQLSYNEKTAKHTIAESNWEDAAAWKDHRLVLKNANIAELKLRIKQLYNIDVIVEGNILDNETFGLSFQQNAEFTDVMTVLEQLYDIKYRKTNTGQFYIYRH